jgi:REP element-mobilizing transposase RayT
MVSSNVNNRLNSSQRKVIRLPNYDYAQPGAYFVTICTQKNKSCFGVVTKDELLLNDAGRMIEKWYFEVMSKFQDIKCCEYVVMPNHFHCIIENVGADLRVCPECSRKSSSADNDSLGNLGEHIGSPLQRIIQWFKTMTTNEYIRNVKQNGWQPFDKKLWQRGYYEHVIRNEAEWLTAAQYILDNPLKVVINNNLEGMVKKVCHSAERREEKSFFRI